MSEKNDRSEGSEERKMPELSPETKHVLYYLLRDAMREGGELEDTFDSLFTSDQALWAKVQREVALLSGWCFQGIPPHLRGRQ